MSLRMVQIGNAKLYNADCREVLALLPDNSIDSIVTDPPYELGFMGKGWDASGIAYDVAMWRECLRVLKPGGHLLAFSGTRTYHRMAVAIEDAGFEIRDQIPWLHGQGFPKNHDISKAIDEAAGKERTEVIGKYQPPGMDKPWNLQNATDTRNVEVFASSRNNLDILAPVTDEAKQWKGWGTALKPANEPICMARKPLDGTHVENILKYGTGAINIDDCRVGTESTLAPTYRMTSKGINGGGFGSNEMDYARNGQMAGSECGRWPANVIHDGSECIVSQFPTTSSGVMKGGTVRAAQDEPGSVCYGTYGGNATNDDTYGDMGSAARFFYEAKPSPTERHEGLEYSKKFKQGMTLRDAENLSDQDEKRGNYHPTVKPVAAIAYLQKLVTPPGGTTLDLFGGSGTGGVAAIENDFVYICAENDTTEGYFDNILVPRISYAYSKPKQKEMFA